MGIPSQDQGGQEASGKLSEALNQADAELVPIEEMLGVQEGAVTAKEERGDLPSRLDTQIDHVNELTTRLTRVKGVVNRLKEAVG